jgi:DNA-binding CsgD family transcriptional regulator
MSDAGGLLGQGRAAAPPAAGGGRRPRGEPGQPAGVPRPDPGPPGDPEATALIERAWAIAIATGEDQKTAIAGGARIELAWLEGDLAGVRSIGADLLEVAVRASHGFLRGEVLRYLRRAGEPVEPFPGCLPAFAAGIIGDWATAARRWEETGNPYHQALELTESPEWRWPPTGCGSSTASGRSRRRGWSAASSASGASGASRGGRERPPGPTRGRLTDRQLEVLGLLAHGRTNAEIADRLYLSRRTVDTHVAALLARLGVGSRRDAVAAAADLGLIGPASPRSRRPQRRGAGVGDPAPPPGFGVR